MKTLVTLLALVLFMVQSAFAGSTCAKDDARVQELRQFENGFYEAMVGLHGPATVPAKMFSMVERLQAASQQLAGAPLRVLGLGDPDIAAYAGHSMVVFSAGLSSPANELTDAEIAAVVAHELAHVEARHSLNWACSLVERFGTPTVTLAEAREAAMSAMVNSPDELFPAVLKEKHANEFYADRRGMELLRAAGYQPEAMVTFMQKRHQVELAHGAASQAATHPSALSRTAAALSALADYARTMYEQ